MEIKIRTEVFMGKAFLAVLMVLAMNTYVYGEIALPDFEKQLLERGVGQYNNDSYNNLMQLLGNEIERADAEVKRLKAELKNNEDMEKAQKEGLKDLVKQNQFVVKYYKHAHNLLEETLLNPKDYAQRVDNFNTVKRLMYSVEADSAPLSKTNFFSFIYNAVRRFDLTIPYVPQNERGEPIGLEQAEKESKNLVLKSDSVRFLTPNELSQMSTNQLADLDILPTHISWKTEKARLETPQSWNDLEKDITQKVEKILRADDDLGEESAREFSLENARKVLFLKEIKTSATSPKVDTKYAYGMDWKLKWGNEVQIEPVNNRLYMKLGSKFTDLVYANQRGVDGLVLILGDNETPGSCNNINTYELLRECLLTSKYLFDVEPYKLETGIISESNVSDVLKNIPKNGLKENKKKKLLGRTFVTFNESMVEFKPKKTIELGGPIALSTVGATEDRVSRGLMIFNMWLNNIDGKDDNAKSVLIEDDINGIQLYQEYIHDFGSSMGNVGQTGRVNGLKDTSFVDANHLFKTLKFNQWMLYRPRAWDMATFTDALWMAKKLATIKKTDLEEIFSYSLWPDFFQQTFVRKMQVRRNAILKEMGLKNLIPIGEEKVSEINIKVSLKTDEERQAVAQKYNISLKKLNQMLKGAEKIRMDGKSEYVDVVVENSKVSSCNRSVIINLMESGPNPSGLERRVRRSSDNKALPDCMFDPDGLLEKEEGK